MTSDDNSGTESSQSAKVIGHILPRAGNEGWCEAWVNLFRKFEGVEIEEIEWDSHGKTAFEIRSDE